MIWLAFLKLNCLCIAEAIQSFRVGAARFELATSWSQTRRDDRATLRPDRFQSPGCKSKGSTAIKET
jgi:hypothetical protein